MSLTDKLSNLHLLLRVQSHARWPLRVHFFAADVHQAWLKWCPKVDQQIPSTMDVVFEPRLTLAETAEVQSEKHQTVSTDTKKPKPTPGQGGIQAIDPTYMPLKSVVEKSGFLLADGEVVSCSVCKEHVQGGFESATLVCPCDDCNTAFHLECLSRTFVQEEGIQSLLPVKGSCPVCKTPLRWVELVREMTLRMRGQRDVARLLKKTRTSKPKQPKTGRTKSAQPVTEDEIDEDSVDEELDRELDEIDEELENDELDEDGEHGAHFDGVIDEPLQHEALEEDDMMSVASADTEMLGSSKLANLKRANQGAQKLELVIEDSDWEGIEVLD